MIMRGCRLLLNSATRRKDFLHQWGQLGSFQAQVAAVTGLQYATSTIFIQKMEQFTM
jgi:hypothetical protein